MKKTYFLIVLSLWLFACRHKVDKIVPYNSTEDNPNKVSLTYNGQLIDIKNIKIEKSELDLGAGMGFRAFGEKKLEEVNGHNYYIILDYQIDSTKAYRFHKINFGVNKKISTVSYYQTVYAANLTPGYNVTNFQYTTSTKDSVINGTFSGKLRSLYDGDIEVSNGTFHLDFKTARDY